MSDRPDGTVLHVGGASPYDVVIARGLAAGVPAMLGDSVRKVAFLYDSALAGPAQPVLDALVDEYDVLALGLPSGEQAKTIENVSGCWDAMGEHAFTRSDAVVSFGGGATTDMAGFVAATWLRGVAVVHIPTTLLAMVDAAVGGKTAIDTAAGKNLVGAFHEPAGVICDLDLLDTLPDDDLTAGLGEVVKCGFIADPEILAIVEKDPDAVRDTHGEPLRELIERAIRVKIAVVVGDLKETGGAEGHPGREVLNYGHTLAHALEKASGYRIRHGEAVSLGCVYAAEVAHRHGLIDDDLLARHRSALGSVGLPTGFAGASFEDLLATMRVDKKSRGDQLRFVVLHGLADPHILAGPDEDVLRAAYDALGERG